jgi:Ca2+-dependent lipid-binding protein
MSTNLKISSYSFIRLKIVEAFWIKDADFFGKQDPFILIKYNGKEFKTTVKDEAGKHAVYNETFNLFELQEALDSSV